MKRFLPLLLLIASPALAQEQVYRLSEAEKQAAIEEASRQPEQTTRLPATRLPLVSGRAPGTPDNRPHGEVGMMIGTGGSRAIWGSTAIPLGESGSASIGFSTGRFPGLFGNPYASPYYGPLRPR
jgi:hypothetical protein